MHPIHYVQAVFAFFNIFLWIYLIRKEKYIEDVLFVLGILGTLIVNVLFGLGAYDQTKNAHLSVLAPLIGAASNIVIYPALVYGREGWKRLTEYVERWRIKTAEEEAGRKAHEADMQDPAHVLKYAEERIAKARKYLVCDEGPVTKYDTSLGHITGALRELVEYKTLLEERIGSGPSEPAKEYNVESQGEQVSSSLQKKLDAVKMLIRHIYDGMARLPDLAGGLGLLEDGSAITSLLEQLEAEIRSTLPRRLLIRIGLRIEEETKPAESVVENRDKVIRTEEIEDKGEEKEDDDALLERELAKTRQRLGVTQ